MINECETMYPITRAVRRAEFFGAWASVFTVLAIAPVPVLATAPEPWRERTLWLVRQGYDEEARVPFAVTAGRSSFRDTGISRRCYATMRLIRTLGLCPSPSARSKRSGKCSIKTI
jgi:hypothetical protein